MWTYLYSVMLVLTAGSGMRTETVIAWLVCVGVCGWATDSRAQAVSAVESVDFSDEAEPIRERQSPLEARAALGLAIGGKLGAGLGAPFNDLGATPVLELELGYLPLLGAARPLEIFVSGQYAQPGMDGSATEFDPRAPGDERFTYEVTQEMFTLSLGAIYHIDVGSALLMPYGGFGGRMYLLRTQASAQVGGQRAGDSDETQTDFGLVLLGGVELFVGPGALLTELSFGWAALDGYIMRDTNLGALSLALGYRVIL